jgi:predicted transcriptional regulator
VTTRHRVAKVYSAALSELRNNHLEEFDRIYFRMLEEQNIETKLLKAARVREETLGLIRDNPGITRLEMLEALAIPGSTFQVLLRELKAEGLVESGGSGCSHMGYWVPDLPKRKKRGL